MLLTPEILMHLSNERYWLEQARRYETPTLTAQGTLRDLTAAGSAQCAPWSTYGTKEQWEAS